MTTSNSILNLPALVYAVKTGREFQPKDYRSDGQSQALGHLYFWKMSTTQIVKIFPELKDKLKNDEVIVKVGYAKADRKNGNHYQIGGVQRARECLRDWEKMCGEPAGTFLARVYVIAVHNVNEALAAEQYFHGKNQGSDIWFTPWIQAKAAELGASAPGGKTEFYLGNIRSLYAKFLNCQKQTNKKIGFQMILNNGCKGPSGWRLPLVGRTLNG